MEKSVEIKASSVELAVEKALEELGTERDKVEVEVISKGGIFSKAQVKVSIKETAADRVGDFVNGILMRMNVQSTASVTEDDEAFNISIDGDDSGAVIGYRGEVLDALQYLTLTLLNQEKLGYKKVVVDCENYREKRKETLTALALRLAEKAHRTARKVALEPMNPFERRIIHSALIDSEIARTESEGEEPNRKVIIIPVGVALKDGRRPQGKGRNGRNDRNGKGGKRDFGDRRGGKKEFRNERSSDRPRRDREESEVEDGREFRGYYTGSDDFVKSEPIKTGPPKYKSFGGQKKF